MQTKLLDALVSEQMRRKVRSAPIEIINLNGAVTDPDLLAVAAGSLNVLVARAGSGLVKKAKAAVAGGNDAFNAFLRPLVVQYTKKRSALTSDAMARAILRQKAFGEVRYGGERVASGVFVPAEFDALPITLPYNGGAVLTNGLELREYLDDDLDEGFEAVALKVDPVLSAAERAALKLVPKSQLGRNVGAMSDCETTWVAVFVVAATLVAAFTLGAAGAATVTTTLAIKVKEVHLKDEVIKAAGPMASARMLVEKRREAMRARAF